jgi:ABC-type sugar transport system substrate-binding protein
MRRWFFAFDNVQMGAHGNVFRWASRAAVGAMLLSTAVAAIGCDSNSFVPPQPEELRGTGTTLPIPLKDAAPDSALLELASARSFEIVLAPRDGDEAELWRSAARMQSGIDKIKNKVAITSASNPRSNQIELIREAMTRNPRALIVEPVDPSDGALVEAIAETRAKGIPVVLFGVPITVDKFASPSPSTSALAPLVVVAPPSFSSSARELVASAIRNAKTAELDPNGGAILLINTIGDAFISARAVAIREALNTAGISPVEEIRFDGDTAAGEKLVKESLKAHPKSILLFTVDYASTVAVRSLLSAGFTFGRAPKSDESSGPKEVPLFVVAGCYTSDTNMQDTSIQTGVAAVAEFTPVRLLRKAIATATNLSQGKTVSSPVELMVTVDDRPLHAGKLRAAVANAKKPPDAQ